MADLYGSITSGLFPAAPGMDPEQAQAARNQAMLTLGMGLMSYGGRGRGGLGTGLMQSYMGAQQNYLGAMDNAYRNRLLTREEDRAEAREERAVSAEGRAVESHEATQRQNAAEVMRGIAQQASVSPDPTGLWRRVVDDPALRKEAERLGVYSTIQAAVQTADETDDALVAQQVAARTMPFGSQTQIKPPASIAEYNLAVQQGYGDTFEKWLEDRPGTMRVVDVAGGKMAFDPRTGQMAPLSSLQQEAGAASTMAGAEASGKVTGTSQAEGIRDLPKVQSQGTVILDVLDQIEKHPGLQTAVGVKGASSLFGLKETPLAGTQAADFVALVDQASGSVFLQAFQELKGGGHITEIEGQKAEQAMGRIRNRDQSEGGYKKAIQDLREIIQTGMERARQKAGKVDLGNGVTVEFIE